MIGPPAEAMGGLDVGAMHHSALLRLPPPPLCAARLFWQQRLLTGPRPAAGKATRSTS